MNINAEIQYHFGPVWSLVCELWACRPDWVLLVLILGFSEVVRGFGKAFWTATRFAWRAANWLADFLIPPRKSVSRSVLPLVALLVCGASALGQSYDSTRYTKSSQYSDIYQSCNIYVVVAWGTNVPAGTYNIMTSTGTDAHPVYMPGGYNVTKTAALGAAQSVSLAVQTFNAAAGSGQNPYVSSTDYTAAYIQNHMSTDPQPFTVSAPNNKVCQGVEWRDASVPAWYTPGQVTGPNVYNWVIQVGSGAVTNTAKFPIQIAANDGRAHSVSVYDNGSLVGTVSIAAGTKGGTPVANAGAPVSTWANAGDQIKYVDDDGASSTITIPANAFLEGNTSWTAPTNQYLIAYDNTPNTPTPTPAPTGGGDTTAPYSPPSTAMDNNGNPVPTQPAPSTAVNNGGTTISGTSNGATNQDIYNDVYHALEDAGHDPNGYTNPSLTAFSLWSSNGYTSPTGTGNTILDGQSPSTMAQNIWNNWTTIKQSIQTEQGNITNIQNAATSMMPSLGGVPSQTLQLSFPVPAALFGVAAFTLDATPYQTVISNFRLVCSVTFAVMLFYSFVKYARGALADLPR